MLVAETFLGSLVKLYGKRIVCYDGRTWCPEACSSLSLMRILHSCLKRALLKEQSNQSKKDITECFDDYYPSVRKSDCNRSHVYQWIILLVYVYDRSGFHIW
jgi:hypothetical protein